MRNILVLYARLWQKKCENRAFTIYYAVKDNTCTSYVLTLKVAKNKKGIINKNKYTVQPLFQTANPFFEGLFFAFIAVLELFVESKWRWSFDKKTNESANKNGLWLNKVELP